MDKSQYRLLSANEIDKFDGYDRVVAQSHIANVGCIIVDSTYGDPIDNDYDLEEIYQAIESTKMYENKKKQALLEQRISNALLESLDSKQYVEKLDKLYECYDKLQEAYHHFGVAFKWYSKNKQEIDDFIANSGPFVGGYRKMLDSKIIPFAKLMFRK